MAGPAEALAAIPAEGRGLHDPRPRPHARDGRSAVQGRRARFPRTSRLPARRNVNHCSPSSLCFLERDTLYRWSTMETRMTAHTQKIPVSSRRSIRSGPRSRPMRARSARTSRRSAALVISNVLNHDSFEAALAHRLAERLDHTDVSADLIRQAFHDALDAPAGDRRRGTRRSGRDARARSRLPPGDRAAALLQGLPGDPDPSLRARAVTRRAAATSRSICRAARARCSRSTSTRPRGSARASCSTTAPASSSARPR